jgi:hypothetical protein
MPEVSLPCVCVRACTCNMHVIQSRSSLNAEGLSKISRQGGRGAPASGVRRARGRIYAGATWRVCVARAHADCGGCHRCPGPGYVRRAAPVADGSGRVGWRVRGLCARRVGRVVRCRLPTRRAARAQCLPLYLSSTHTTAVDRTRSRSRVCNSQSNYESAIARTVSNVPQPIRYGKPSR